VAQPIAALFGFAKKHFAFFRGFFAQAFLAIVEGCPHISRLGGDTEPKARLRLWFKDAPERLKRVNLSRR
jgi:hypothetical protein